MTPKHKCKSIIGYNHRRGDQKPRASFLSLGELTVLQQADQTDRDWPGLISFCFSLTEHNFCLGQHRYYKLMLDANYTTNTPGMLFPGISQMRVSMLGCQVKIGMSSHLQIANNVVRNYIEWQELAIRAMGTQNTSYAKVNGPAKREACFMQGTTHVKSMKRG